MESNDQFKISFRLSNSEMNQIIKYDESGNLEKTCSPRSLFKTFVLLWPFFLGMFVLLIFCLYAPYFRTDDLLLMAVLLISSLYYLYLNYPFPRAIRMAVSASGIHVEDSEFVLWQEITKLTEDDFAYVFYGTDNNFVAIPKKFLSPTQELNLKEWSRATVKMDPLL